jgi:RimJ/RimL family protein N-acetyltransferase
LKLLYGHDDFVARFVQENLKDQAFQNCSAIGVLDNDMLIAGVVYSNWLPTAGVVEMSVFAATPKWFNRGTLKALLSWPFDGLGCQMIVLRVSEKNARMCRLADGVGFIGHRIPRLLGRNEDCIVYTLTTEDWSASRFMRTPDAHD